MTALGRETARLRVRTQRAQGFHGRFSNRSKQRISAPPCRITRYSPSPRISAFLQGDHSGLPADAPVPPPLHPTSYIIKPNAATDICLLTPDGWFLFLTLSCKLQRGPAQDSQHAPPLLQVPQRCTEEAGGVGRHGNAVIDWLVMQHSCKQEMGGWLRIGWRHTPQPPSTKDLPGPRGFGPVAVGSWEYRQCRGNPTTPRQDGPDKGPMYRTGQDRIPPGESLRLAVPLGPGGVLGE